MRKVISFTKKKAVEINGKRWPAKYFNRTAHGNDINLPAICANKKKVKTEIIWHFVLVRMAPRNIRFLLIKYVLICRHLVGS